jgi:flagellar basal body rod protein FlgF
MILFLLLMLAASPASAQTVVLDDAACQAITRHVPDADVNYTPGVDVKGKPVVEADINAAPIKMPETVTFDITVDALKHVAISAPAGTEALADVGRVEVKPDGSMLFNGAPLEGEAEAMLRSLCEDKSTIKQGQNNNNGGLQKRPRGDYNR